MRFSKTRLAANLLSLSALVATTAASLPASALSLTQLSRFQVDTGAYPSVAAASEGYILDVHNLQTPYTGVTDRGTTQLWWDVYGTSLRYFQDSGPYPSVAGNAASGSSSAPRTTPTFVEVAVAETTNEIFYHTATMVTGRVNVSPAHDLGATGIFPAVGIGTLGSTTQTVVVYQSWAYPYNGLMYQTGTLQSDGTINWSSPTSQADTGYSPSIAITPITISMGWINIQGFFVVEVYNKENAPNTAMAMRTGWLNPGAAGIQWHAPFNYDGGDFPHVAICQRSNGTLAIVEAHASTNGNAMTEWYHTGTVSDPLDGTVSLSGSTQYTGLIQSQGGPSIACSGDTVTEEHLENLSDTTNTGAIMSTTFWLN
jgi:hypothetical protein